MRIFGWELAWLLCGLIIICVLIGVVLVPMRTYSIKPSDMSDLNQAAEEQLFLQGMRPDADTLEIAAITDQNSFLAVLTLYERKEQVEHSLLIFERDWRNYLKPPVIYPITRSAPVTLMQRDSIFGIYLIEAGIGVQSKTYESSGYSLRFAADNGAYLRASLVERPWLGDIINWVLLLITLSIANYFAHRGYRAPVYFHEPWKPGDPVMQVEYHKKNQRQQSKGDNTENKV